MEDAAAIVVAIVVASDLRPQTVAQALQCHAFTSLSPLLLPLLLPRICDPKPSQKRYTHTRLRHCRHCCCHCCCDLKSVAEALQIHAFTALSPLLLPRICAPDPQPRTHSFKPISPKPSAPDLPASDPQPQTLSLRPSASDPQPQTLNLRPSTSDPQPQTLNLRPSASDPQPHTLNPRPSIPGAAAWASALSVITLLS